MGTRTGLLGLGWKGAVLWLGLLGVSGAAPVAEAEGGARMILHMLDYISVDYPEFIRDGRVLDEGEYQEQLEFARTVREEVGQLPTQEERGALVEQAQQLLALIENKASGDQVSAAAKRLRWDIIQGYQIKIAPQQAPSLKTTESLYRTHCASCHGIEGYGDGPAAANLEPAPSNFHAEVRQEQRSIYSLFNTITLGVEGTAMPSFREPLSEAQRWALAFYVSAFSITVEERKAGAALWQAGVGKDLFKDLRTLVSQTPREVSARYGEEARQVFTYLRSAPSLLNEEKSPLSLSRRRLEQSLNAYQAGQRERAQQLAIEAYLEGFELIEASLDTVDSGLRQHIEREMMAYRGLLREGAPMEVVQAKHRKLRGLLDQAEERLQGSALSPMAVASSAFIIIVREGLEAVLIVGAIIAFLIRAGRRDAVMYVHLGWIPALLLGVATWFAATYLLSISGASRELTEGIAALAAAAILLYVGFWLHSKAYAKGWQSFITKQVKGALSQRTLWALSMLSFLAVYREVFETVLFYQALWTQAGAQGGVAVLGGFGAGVVVLLILSGIIFYYSLQLPLQLFFGATSVALALLAVVLAGKGMGALQEAGIMPIDPVAFPSMPALGVYSNWQALTLQAVLLLTIVGGFFYNYRVSQQQSAMKS